MAVASNRVVEHFDVIEDVLTCQFSGAVDFAFKRSRLSNWKKLSATALS